MLLNGQNPYTQMPANLPYPLDSPFFYPLVTAIFSIPFTILEPYTSGALFFGICSAILAFAILNDNWWRWPVFLSPCFFIAASVAQWTPLIMAAALLPPIFRSLSFLKPSLGIISFFYRPSFRAIIIIFVVGMLSLLVLPSWPFDWLRIMRQAGGRYVSPFLFPGGFLLVLALISWKRTEGRTLFAMSVIPRHAYWYDGMLLWLLPSNLKQSLILSLTGWVGYLIWDTSIKNVPDLPSRLNASFVWQSLLLYIPALVMVILLDLITLIKNNTQRKKEVGKQT